MRSNNANEELEPPIQLGEENNSEEIAENIDYSTLTVAELKKMLDEKGISYNSRMNKNELINLLKESESEE